MAALPPVPAAGRRIRKAIIPVAGRATRHWPASLAVPKALFPLVDGDGRTKPVLQLILEEAFASGIERACVVTGPGEEGPYRRYLEALEALEALAVGEGGGAGGAGGAGTTSGRVDWPARVSFAIQSSPDGFGHAVLCGRDFAAGEPVLVMLGDHVYRSAETRPCARQLLDCFHAGGAAVSAVQRTPEADLHLFGTVRATPLSGRARAYTVHEIVEKPAVATARERLRVPGVPVGQYLCWFGLHAMTPGLFDVLDEDARLDRRERGELQLTAAQARLAAREPYLAYEVAGWRFDMGDPAGLVRTQQALAERHVRG
jgi:UTP--glucose-1-phosphate uridylyltransferase